MACPCASIRPEPAPALQVQPRLGEGVMPGLFQTAGWKSIARVTPFCLEHPAPPLPPAVLWDENHISTQQSLAMGNRKSLTHYTSHVMFTFQCCNGAAGLPSVKFRDAGDGSVLKQLPSGKVDNGWKASRHIFVQNTSEDRQKHVALTWCFRQHGTDDDESKDGSVPQP